MRAAVMREQRLVVDELPEPVPGPGQVLVKTLACGICGSDLHALRHAERMVEAAREAGAGAFVMDLARDVVMGHEFCAEVLEYGPGSSPRLRRGERVCAMPIVLHAGGVASVGYSNDFPGGYGERMLLAEPLLLPVPNGLPSEAAALTEPLAVGEHAVAKARLERTDAPLVVGCGPVGLAVIAALRRRGVEPIVASEFSPARRALALGMGAHVALDPAQASPFSRLAQEAAGRAAVVFECVGVPGLLDRLCREAPVGGRILVAGVCMEEDRIHPFVPIMKELQLQFVLGYTPDEFAGTLRAIAEGEIDPAPLVTGKVGVDGVAGAFEALASPQRHAKILVEPWREGGLS
jgi:threonine dehydrogenase-like Zn-dependent dehydrogenase